MKNVIKPKNRDGFALILTVIVVTIVMTVGVAIASISASNYLRVAGIEKKAQVRASAESGVVKAQEWIQQQVESGQYTGFQRGDTEVDLGEGRTVTYSVYENTDRPGTETYRVVAKGTAKYGVNESTNTVYADIAPGMANAFDHAIFAEQNLIISGNVKVKDGSVWTNGDISGNISQEENITGPVYAVGEQNLHGYEEQQAIEGQVPFPDVYDELRSKAVEIKNTGELQQALANGNLGYVFLLSNDYFNSTGGNLEQAGNNVKILENINHNIIILAEYYDNDGNLVDIKVNKQAGNENYSVGLFSKSSLVMGQKDFYGILYSMGSITTTGRINIYGTVVANETDFSVGNPTITYSEDRIYDLLNEHREDLLYSGAAIMMVVRWQEEKS